jgi:isopenicillin-N epimerase
MLSPKGAGFLYARPEAQALIEPLIVGWGYHSYHFTPQPESTRYLDYLNWTGTRDPSASLAVPAAIEFMQSHDWAQVRQSCHALLAQTIARICELGGCQPLYPIDSDLYSQMGVAPLPANIDLNILRERMYNEYHVEIPMIDWQGCKGVRISVQAYTSQADLDTLVEGLRVLLPQVMLKK